MLSYPNGQGFSLTSAFSIVRDSIARANVGCGIVSSAADFDGVISANNGVTDLSCMSNCTIRNSRIDFNGTTGIRAVGSTTRTLIIDSVISGNDVQIQFNATSSNAAYGGNIIQGVTSTVVGVAVEIGTNVCNGNTTCP